MLFFLISCLSFILLSKSFSLKSFVSWVCEIRLLFNSLWRELLCCFVCWLKETRHIGICFVMPTSLFRRKSFKSKVESVEETDNVNLLDLPELALECILEKLPPSELCNLARVSKSLRDRCTSDYLWERHMNEKWGRVIGDVAYRHWKWHAASIKESLVLKRNKKRSFIRSLSCVCSTSWGRSKSRSSRKLKPSLPVDSFMALYLSLESGKFWFPAQVYNREYEHAGFMLSCYDADLSYDSLTDTFQARFPPHGPRTPVMEEGIQWNRIRAPPVDTPAHYLHVSDCLNDLSPGDHIEIQWRRNREFPYGWWYGVIGHLDSCDKNQHLCRCRSSDTVVLEFNQYSPGSRWRQTFIDRKNHREEGNETDGFYGGIRKLCTKEEISVWKHLWPRETLQ